MPMKGCRLLTPSDDILGSIMRVVDTFQVSNPASRRYLRSVQDRLGKRAATELAEGYPKRANIIETPKRKGRLQRSFRIKRITLYKYRISWGAPYASYVNDRGRSKGYVGRVKRRAQRDLRTRARELGH